MTNKIQEMFFLGEYLFLMIRIKQNSLIPHIFGTSIPDFIIVADFGYPGGTLLFACPQRFLDYLAFKYFDYDEDEGYSIYIYIYFVVRTKFDIYVLIT